MHAFSGVIPILQTPFTSEDELDLDSLRKEVIHACSYGVPAVAFPAFVSEWWRLSDDDCVAGAAAIIEAADKRTKVILNITAQSTFVAKNRARQFEVMGADGLMCLQPFVIAPSAEDSARHLEEVIGATSLPHIFQLSPTLTGVGLDAHIIAELRSRHPNLCSIKVDFIPPGPTITRLKETIEDPDVTYLIGYAGSQLPDAIRRGAQGLMSGCGHIAEDIAMFESVIRSRGIPSATFQRLLPLLNFETQTIDLSIATHKRLLFEQGIIAQPHLRSPSLVMDEFQECELIELWNAAKTPGTSMPIASNVEARGIDP